MMVFYHICTFVNKEQTNLENKGCFVLYFFILYTYMKECKKYGLKGARRAPQFSKR